MKSPSFINCNVIFLTVLLTVCFWGTTAAEAQTGSIKGYAKDKDSGDGIPNIHVRVCIDPCLKQSDWITEAEDTQTEPVGYYEVTGLPAGTYKVRYLTYSIDTPSYVAQWYNSLDYADAEDVDVKTDQAVSLDDVLLEQGVSITGTVTDADFAPIAEVRVYAYKEGDRDNWVASAIITEPDTNYTLSGLAPGINYKIYFMADGYISEWYDDKRGSVESVPAGAADVLSGTTDIDTVLNKRVSLVPVYYLLLLK